MQPKSQNQRHKADHVDMFHCPKIQHTNKSNATKK